MNLYSTSEIRDCLDLLGTPMAQRTCLIMQQRRSIPNGNTKIYPSPSAFCRRRRTWSFHVVVLQKTAEKGPKIPNARVQLY